MNTQKLSKTLAWERPATACFSLYLSLFRWHYHRFGCEASRFQGIKKDRPLGCRYLRQLLVGMFGLAVGVGGATLVIRLRARNHSGNNNVALSQNRSEEHT